MGGARRGYGFFLQRTILFLTVLPVAVASATQGTFNLHLVNGIFLYIVIDREE